MKRWSWIPRCAVMTMLALGAPTFPSAAESRQEGSDGQLRFDDLEQQTKEFIGYSESIRLTPEQQRIKHEALASIPAPCCARFSIETCCCPCNLARSVWGLAHHLIANRQYDAPRVREAVLAWLKFTNQAGYAGDACFRGGCQKPFREDGCGGMKPTDLRL